MRVVFQGQGRSVVWDFPFFSNDDESGVMDWAQDAKPAAEAANGVAQLIRVLQEWNK
jgi:hypothetical protein